MAKTANDLRRLLNGSIRYEFEGSVLELQSYWTGQSIKLDLYRITDEMLERLIVEDDEEEENEEDEEE